MDEIDEEALEPSEDVGLLENGLEIGAFACTEVDMMAEAELAFAEDGSDNLSTKDHQSSEGASNIAVALVDSRETLESLKQSALQKKATALGATDEEVEAAIDDETNSKGALIDLILARQNNVNQVAIVEGETGDGEQAVVDAYQQATEEAAFEIALDTVDEAEEQLYYSLAASVDADGEEEEEEEDGEGDEVVEPGAAPGDANDQEDEEEEEADDDSVMFFEDTGNVAAEPPDVTASMDTLVSPRMSDEFDDMEHLDEPMQLAICAQCGLPGHATNQCPFGHPEDIELGDMDESDSDNELIEKHPLLARYISQHTAALHPKHKKGLTGERRYFGDDKARQCWVCGRDDHDSSECSLKCCFFCGGQGHDGRDCPERSSICTHCRCKGHIPVDCPTMASKALVSFANAHCMRCGDLGHANCGIPPLAPQLKAAPPQNFVTFQGALPLGVPFPGPPAMNGPLLFNAGLPPPTPVSPPASPLGPLSPAPGDSFRLVRPRPPNGSDSLFQAKSLSGPRGVPSKSFSSLANGNSDVPYTASKAPNTNAPHTSGKSSLLAGVNGAHPDRSIAPSKAPIVKMHGKAAIAKVPGKAPITKVAPQGSKANALGKAHIVKVPGQAPITKEPARAKQESISLMKASAKTPSRGSGPPPKKQRTW